MAKDAHGISSPKPPCITNTVPENTPEILIQKAQNDESPEESNSETRT